MGRLVLYWESGLYSKIQAERWQEIDFLFRDCTMSNKTRMELRETFTMKYSAQ